MKLSELSLDAILFVPASQRITKEEVSKIEKQQQMSKINLKFLAKDKKEVNNTKCKRIESFSHRYDFRWKKLHKMVKQHTKICSAC